MSVAAPVPPPAALRSPRETWTDTTAVLIWDKPARAAGIASFDILLDGQKIAATTQLCFKLEGLAPSTTYAVTLRTLDVHGRLSEPAPALAIVTLSVGPVLDVTQAPYAADPTGRTLATAAIQRAIDDCPPGGTVFIPPGTYTTSGLFLKSHITLRLDGTLEGSLDLKDYSLVWSRFGLFRNFYASMINIGRAEGDIVENVRLLGRGKIDGNGEKLRPLCALHAPGTEYQQRNSTLTTLRAKAIYVDGLTFANSACWSVHPILSDDVTFYDVTVDNHDYDLVNGDGINPDACRRVNILRCLIRSEDDNISIKSGNRDDSFPGQRACEDVLVSDCTLQGGFGISPGLESYYGVRRVTIRNCKIEQCATIFHPICFREGFASRNGQAAGGVIEDITVSGIRYFNDRHRDNMWMRGPLDFDMFYTAGPLDTPDLEHPAPFDDKTPLMRNILLEDIVIVDDSDRHGITLLGRPESNITNIVLRDIQCLAREGLNIANVDHVRLENVSVIATSGAPSLVRHAHDFELRPNLVKNPGFEAGKADWSFCDARIVDDSNPFMDGPHRCSGRRTLKLYTPRSRATQEIPFAATAPATLVLTATGKVLRAGVSGRVVVSALDAAGRVLATYALAFTETGGFLTKDRTFSVPREASALRVEAITDGLAFYVDDLGLFAGPRVAAQAFNDDASCFEYSPGFRHRDDRRQAYYGDTHEALGSDEKITFTFTGTQSRLYGEKAPDAGLVAISLDGAPAQLIDLHADTTLPAQLWLDTGVLTQGDHFITVVTAARAAATAAAPRTAFDYAYVLSER